MHATRRAPSATVSTALLGAPYGVFVGLRATVASPSFSNPLPTINASVSSTARHVPRIERVERGQPAPVAAVVHAATEYVEIVDFDADEVDLGAAAPARHSLRDEHRGVLRGDTDALQLGVQRTQRIATIENIVHDEHGAP